MALQKQQWLAPFVEHLITLLIRKQVKLKSSLVRKLSKARLKFINVIVALSKVRLELLVKLDLSVFDRGAKMRENAKTENLKTSSGTQVTRSDYFYSIPE